MREIEVKAKIADIKYVREKLEKLGCVFSEPVRQEDSIYSLPDVPFEVFKPDINLLRIRKENGKIIFTLKRPQKNEQDALEHETEIQNGEEMAAAIELLGFKKMVEVKKTRQKAKYNNYTICLDEVEGPGQFIEVETFSEDGDPEKIQEEIFKFILSLGLKKEDRVREGYDTLVYLKNLKGAE